MVTRKIRKLFKHAYAITMNANGTRFKQTRKSAKNIMKVSNKEV